MRADLLRFAAELSQRGEAFALATVVRREPPSSARVGDTALITPGGAFHGWLGGSCTQTAVVREALRALEDGAPRLIALSPNPEADRRAGVTALPMTCHSGGSVDIYIEPVLPAPRLIVFGVSPVAQALARLAKAMGFLVDAVDPEADRAAFPDADRVMTQLEAAGPPAGDGSSRPELLVVVATMGRRDEEATTAALALEPAYLGVVASRRRFAEIGEALAARGARPEALAGIASPAGLDLGAHAPAEIAVSILAQIVQRRRSGAASSAPGRAAAPGLASEHAAAMPIAEEAVDPVCGMTVTVATAKWRHEHAGRTFYFCGNGCRERFAKDPDRYLAAARPGAAG
jgi:xanthine dehydrogenase accessory factor